MCVCVRVFLFFFFVLVFGFCFYCLGLMCRYCSTAAGLLGPLDVISVHGHFLRPVSPLSDVMYNLVPLRTGRNFSHARVEARQEGQVVFHAVLTLRRPDQGQREAEAPTTPAASTVCNPEHQVMAPDVEPPIDAEEQQGVQQKKEEEEESEEEKKSVLLSSCGATRPSVGEIDKTDKTATAAAPPVPSSDTTTTRPPYEAAAQRFLKLGTGRLYEVQRARLKQTETLAPTPSPSPSPVAREYVSDHHTGNSGSVREQRRYFWVRTRCGTSAIAAALSEGGTMRAAALAFVSDLFLLHTTFEAHPNLIPTFMASLDHAIWFHGSDSSLFGGERTNTASATASSSSGWLLYEMECPVLRSGRALCTGRLFSRDGRLVASVSQEGLVRARASL